MSHIARWWSFRLDSHLKYQKCYTVVFWQPYLSSFVRRLLVTNDEFRLDTYYLWDKSSCLCTERIICLDDTVKIRMFDLLNFHYSDRMLTHWGRVAHVCVSKLTTIGSDNGLSPGRRQAIIWTNAGILLIWPLGTNVSEIAIEITTFSFKKMRLKVSSAKWRPFVSASMC